MAGNFLDLIGNVWQQIAGGGDNGPASNWDKANPAGKKQIFYNMLTLGRPELLQNPAIKKWVDSLGENELTVVGNNFFHGNGTNQTLDQLKDSALTQFTKDTGVDPKDFTAFRTKYEQEHPISTFAPNTTDYDQGVLDAYNKAQTDKKAADLAAANNTAAATAAAEAAAKTQSGTNATNAALQKLALEHPDQIDLINKLVPGANIPKVPASNYAPTPATQLTDADVLRAINADDPRAASMTPEQKALLTTPAPAAAPAKSMSQIAPPITALSRSQPQTPYAAGAQATILPSTIPAPTMQSAAQNLTSLPSAPQQNNSMQAAAQSLMGQQQAQTQPAQESAPAPAPMQTQADQTAQAPVSIQAHSKGASYQPAYASGDSGQAAPQQQQSIADPNLSAPAPAAAPAPASAPTMQSTAQGLLQQGGGKLPGYHGTQTPIAQMTQKPQPGPVSLQEMANQILLKLNQRPR